MLMISRNLIIKNKKIHLIRADIFFIYVLCEKWMILIYIFIMMIFEAVITFAEVSQRYCKNLKNLSVYKKIFTLMNIYNCMRDSISKRNNFLLRNCQIRYTYTLSILRRIGKRRKHCYDRPYVIIYVYRTVRRHRRMFTKLKNNKMSFESTNTILFKWKNRKEGVICTGRQN